MRFLPALLASTLLACTAANQPDPAQSVTVTATGDKVTAQAPPPLTADSQFQAGSIAKWTCSLAAMRLAEAGMLSLDDTVATLLPGYGGEAGEVTLGELLANRAGLADGLTAALEAEGNDDLLALDLTALNAANRFAAGAPVPAERRGYSYDLVNWILVQAVIEQASGAPLAEAMDRLVIAPAALPATRFDSGTPILADAPEVVGEVMPIPGWLGCAGGMVTTPADLVQLMRFAATDALGEEALATFTTPTTPEENYALGGRVRKDEEGAPIFWLSGSNGAFKSRAAYRLGTGDAFAAMNAVDDADGLEEAMEDWLVRTRQR
ncbi:serine hydrolase domain-containing protein [Sphingomicrobium arenosum]|uniref:serine hydrolase domain-containing protein n=1 Tax=Sphingomicrobium arenosum TaxID=2233861 RepID=UPI00223EA45D|nr:serine hydrolase domain-containing protein [Sphingomicrobium arenosum]